MVNTTLTTLNPHFFAYYPKNEELDKENFPRIEKALKDNASSNETFTSLNKKFGSPEKFSGTIDGNSGHVKLDILAHGNVDGVYDTYQKKDPLSLKSFAEKMLQPLGVIQKILQLAVARGKNTQKTEFDFRLLSCASGRPPELNSLSYHQKLHEKLVTTFEEYFNNQVKEGSLNNSPLVFALNSFAPAGWLQVGSNGEFVTYYSDSAENKADARVKKLMGQLEKDGDALQKFDSEMKRKYEIKMKGDGAMKEIRTMFIKYADSDQVTSSQIYSSYGP